MKTITLNNGKETLVDDADFDWLNQWRWQWGKDGTKFGKAMRTHRVPGGKRSLYMHRLIMGAPDGMEVDHRDGNGLNNQRHNLRLATHAQNCRNASARSTNRLQTKGVRKQQRGGYQARISFENVTVSIGTFPTLDAARQAYNEAALKLHGEFARINPEPTQAELRAQAQQYLDSVKPTTKGE